jgi:hypothetical protein
VIISGERSELLCADCVSISFPALERTELASASGGLRWLQPGPTAEPTIYRPMSLDSKASHIW